MLFLALSPFVTTLAAEIPAPAAARDPMTHFFEQSFGNLKDELALVKQEGKLGIFIMFNDPDCPWCQKMKATMLSQPAVQDYYRQHFRLLHVDTRGDTTLTNFSGREMTEKDFAFKEHRVRATPVFIFFGLDGKPMLRYTGAARDVDNFCGLGNSSSAAHTKPKTSLPTSASVWRLKNESANLTLCPLHTTSRKEDKCVHG